MNDRDAQVLTETPPTPLLADVAGHGDATAKERDARLFGYKRTAAENRISDLFTALEASDAQSARKQVEDLLYTIRRAATFQGIDLNVRFADLTRPRRRST